MMFGVRAALNVLRTVIHGEETAGKCIHLTAVTFIGIVIGIARHETVKQYKTPKVNSHNGNETENNRSK